MGLGPFPVWRDIRIWQTKNKIKCPGGVPAQARATCNEVDLLLPWEWWYVTLLFASPGGAPCCSFCCLGRQDLCRKSNDPLRWKNIRFSVSPVIPSEVTCLTHVHKNQLQNMKKRKRLTICSSLLYLSRSFLVHLGTAHAPKRDGMHSQPHLHSVGLDTLHIRRPPP